jgi:starch phosphorylase
LKAPEIRVMREQRSYRPADYCDYDPQARRVVDAFASNRFCPHEPDLFAWIRQMLLDDNDEYFHVADLRSYIDAQERAAAAFMDRAAWTRMAILNVARVGKFSSDRTVREYARDIWHIEPAL